MGSRAAPAARGKWGTVTGACLAAGALLAGAAPLAAQWNSPATLAVVRRGVLARQQAQPDSTLASYRTRAHGFVFFLAQAGSGLETPPRLIKADELDVEVYWRAPATSKQVILGWRDGRWLPTDIEYHRDHLGIVANNFGDLIRVGGGDEVRDVVHPLAIQGPDLYDYRLTDSVTLRTRDTVLVVQEVEVRPRDPAAPRVIGTLSLDAATGHLVRFRFSFTPAAYFDASLEDISIVLENARVEERWWLPYRQEVEIRRRVSWLDFPLRSIIRGRWEIGDYELNAAVPPQVLRGPFIGGLRAPADTGWTWDRPLAVAVGDVAQPVERQDFEVVRAEIERLAEGHLLSGLPPVRLGITSISDVAHVNRVQGLALGAGLLLRPSTALTLRPRVAFGTSDARLLGDLSLAWTRGPTTVTVEGGRRLRDLADHPVISGIVNSITAQEGGLDHGDYTLIDAASLGLSRRLGIPARLSISLGVEDSRSVEVSAVPAHGSYRPNPALGSGTIGVGRIGLEYRAASLDWATGVSGDLGLEGGTGDRDYFRISGLLRWRVGAGPGQVQMQAAGGAGSEDLPAYRTFAFGGWGTLPGEPFRAWGGRRAALLALEYRIAAPFPAIPLGAFASTGRSIVLAPFVATGVAGGAAPSGVPWRPTTSPRTVAGLAAEFFHQLLRVEAGVSLDNGDIGVSVDVSREWWEIL